MSQSPLDSKGKESEHKKVRSLELPTITQIRLASIQQLQAEIVRMHEDGEIVARHDAVLQLRKEWKELRRDLLRGAQVEPGPIESFIRVTGRGKKRRLSLILK